MRYLLLIMILLGLGSCASEPVVAGGSSDQGNAIEVAVVASTGGPAIGVSVEMHSKNWIAGRSVDPNAGVFLTDSAGKIRFEKKTGVRLLAKSGASLGWIDIDSTMKTAQIVMAPGARVEGVVRDSGRIGDLAVPGTSLLAQTNDTGFYVLLVPAGLGHLIYTRGDTSLILPEFASVAGGKIQMPVASTYQVVPKFEVYSEFLAATVLMSGATEMVAKDTAFVRVSPVTSISFGKLLPPEVAEGRISFSFRPLPEFSQDSAWTILGEQGGRLHVGFLKGVLFFQKNEDGVHHYVTSKMGQLTQKRWYSIDASWGAKGMVLRVDGVPVAWSEDNSGYQQDSRGDQYRIFGIGDKGYCCMDALRITRPLNAAGDYANIRFIAKQGDPWGNGFSKACPVQDVDDLLPRCGIQIAVNVSTPLW